ncbi:MAG TPA: DUF4442 domain-containing protein [Opitutaceae bacterium]
MAESWRIKRLRWRFNWYPAFRRTGARVVHIAEDLSEATVRLPLNAATRNIHGTIYGGAMYAAVDPVHAVLLGARLGPAYEVWMKAAAIEFKRPGRSDLFAHAHVPVEEVSEVRRRLTNEPKVDRAYSLALAHADGEVAAVFQLTLHVRRRETAPAVPEGDFPV